MPPRGSRYAPGSVKTAGKRGPKPFPGTRRKRCDLRVPPAKPILQRKHHHSRKRKIEVLTWLIFHRVPEPRRTGFGEPYLATRMKNGQVRMSVEEQAELKRSSNSFAVLYRPPTYQEAEAFWKIPCSTITSWWHRKDKYLTPDILAQAKGHRIELMGGSYRTYETPPSHEANEAPPPPETNETSPPHGSFHQHGLPSISPWVTATTSISTDPSQATTSEPAVMDTSDGSDSENDDDDDDDSDLPDLETALGGAGNTGSTEETGDAEENQEFQDAPEFQQQAEEEDSEKDDAEGAESAVYALQAY